MYFLKATLVSRVQEILAFSTHPLNMSWQETALNTTLTINAWNLEYATIKNFKILV